MSNRQATRTIAQMFSNSEAYIGAVHDLPEDHKQWAKAAHYNWSIDPAPLSYKVDGKQYEIKDRVVLQRSDTHQVLGVVAPKFKPVQPKAILDFYEDVSKEFDFKLEAAGQAQGGKKLWALARTPYTIEPLKGDKTNGYLMFLTGCDGTSATKLIFVSFRLWCLNQLRVALQSSVRDALAGKKNSRVGRAHNRQATVLMRLTHRRDFDHKKAKETLAVMDQSWKVFDAQCKLLAKTKVTDEQATNFMLHLAYPGKPVDELAKLRESSVGTRLLKTYKEAPGQKEALGTAWGLVNGVTRFIDHESRAKNPESRITRAWVTTGARQKLDAFNAAVALAEGK